LTKKQCGRYGVFTPYTNWLGGLNNAAKLRSAGVQTAWRYALVKVVVKRQKRSIFSTIQRSFLLLGYCAIGTFLVGMIVCYGVFTP
jgi:hypothetical protein